MTHSISYNLLRGRLVVRTPETWIGRLYDNVMHRCADDDQQPVVFTVTAERGTPEDAPPDARVLHKGPGQEGEWVEIFTDGRKTWTIRPKHTSLCVDDDAARARLVQPDERFTRDSGTLAMHALDYAVAKSGQSLVHSACLANPSGSHHALVW